MNKNPPSTGQIAAMVLFTLSVFALLLFLWVSFGGTLPLKAEGLPLQGRLPRGRAARQGGRRADRGRQRRQGQGDRAGPGRPHARAPRSRSTRASRRSRRDTRAILRQKSLLGETFVELTPGQPGHRRTLPDGGTLARTQRRGHRRARRGLPRLRPAHAPLLPGVAARRRDRLDGQLRLRPQRLARQRRAVLRGRRRPAAAAGPSRRSRCGGSCATPAACSTPISRENGQLRGLVTNGDATFSALASRDDALAETFQILPTFLRETRTTVEPARALRAQHRPARARPARAGRRPGADVRDLGDLSPDLERLFNDIDPLVDASATGVPAAQRFLEGAEPVLEATHNFLPRAQPDPVLPVLQPQDRSAQFLTAGAARARGQRRRAATRRTGRASTTCRRWRSSTAARSSSAPRGRRGSAANAYVAPNAYQRADPAGRDRELRLQPERRRAARPVRLGRRRPRRPASWRRGSCSRTRSTRACGAARRPSWTRRRGTEGNSPGEALERGARHALDDAARCSSTFVARSVRISLTSGASARQVDGRRGGDVLLVGRAVGVLGDREEVEDRRRRRCRCRRSCSSAPARRAASRPPMSCSSASSPVRSQVGRPSRAPRRRPTTPRRRCRWRRGWRGSAAASATAGKQASTSRTGIEELTQTSAPSGSSRLERRRAPSARTRRGPRPAPAGTSASAARQDGQPARVALGRAHLERGGQRVAASGGRGAASSSSARRVGSCQAAWGSSTTWGASASQARSGFEVGMSPTRSTSPGACAAAKRSARSSTS